MSEDSPLPSQCSSSGAPHTRLCTSPEVARPPCVPQGVGYTPVSSGAMPGRSAAGALSLVR